MNRCFYKTCFVTFSKYPTVYAFISNDQEQFSSNMVLFIHIFLENEKKYLVNTNDTSQTKST